MSLNKVLNRPLFRQQALKKGALKPVKAQIGTMVGGPTTPPGGNPNYFPVINQQGFYGRQIRPRIQRTITGAKNLAKGIPGIAGLYGGLEAVNPNLAGGLAFMEAAGLASLATPQTRQIGQYLMRPSSAMMRLGPLRGGIIGAGIYGLGKTVQGFRDRKEEREFIKDYAKKNNIDVDEALALYERDLPGVTRGFKGLRASDLAKAVTIGSQDFKTAATPLTDEEKDKIGNLNEYISKRRNFQDLDALAKDVKQSTDTLQAEAQTPVDPNLMTSPDDAMLYSDLANQNLQAQAQDTYQKATVLTGQLMNKYDVKNPQKAANIASAIVEGKINEENVPDIIKNDKEYAKIENKTNDPMHPNFKATTGDEGTEEQKQQAQQKFNQAMGIENETSSLSGDRDIDLGKQFLVDLQNPRETEVNPKSYFLTKLALGMISGKTNKRGIAGAVEIAANAMGPAFDGAIALKMKNDENFRDFATAMFDRNIKLYDMFNKDIKQGKFEPGSVLVDGRYLPGKRDKESQRFYTVNADGSLTERNAAQNTFFPAQKKGPAYAAQVKLLSDGLISKDILTDSLALMKNPKFGDKVVGPAAIVLSAIDTATAVPKSVLEGLGGLNQDFTMTNNGDLSDEEFKVRQKRADKVLEKFEKNIEKAIKANPSAASVLGKLEVNARFLTYSLANALKEKDRLTNRDLELLEELTSFKLFKNPDRIREKYEELLRRVEQKNAARRVNFGTLGSSDQEIENVTGLLSSAVGVAGAVAKDKKINTVDEAFQAIMDKAIR